MVDHDAYNEQRWIASAMSDDDLRAELRIRRTDVRRAIERQDFFEWREAHEWIDVVNDEIAFRDQDPGTADE